VVAIIEVIIGLYIAFIIGANDAANAIGTAVGSKLMSYKKTVLLFGIFVLIGCLNGYNVGHTMSSIVSGSITC